MAKNTVQIIVEAITGEAQKDLDGVNKSLSGISRNAAEMGKSLSSLGDKMTLGLTLPLVAAGTASISMASNFNEAMSKVQVVFGDSTKEVEKFIDSVDGISKREAANAVGTFGNLFRSMGLASDQSAEMSSSLVKLAVDLSSFNDIPVDVALEKLRAGISGESEPLKSLGVIMNETTLKAEAMRLGILGQGEAMSAAVKAQAAYSLIMRDTALAQGDLERTSGSLANQTREFKKQVDDLAVSLGTVLLPMATSALTSLNGLVKGFNEMSPGAQKATVGIGVLVAAIGPLAKIIGGAISAWTTLSTLFGAGGALAGAGTAISGSLTAIGAALAAVTAPVWLLIAAIVALGATIAVFGDDAAKTLGMVGQIIGALAQRSVYEFQQLALSFYKVGEGIVQGIWTGIKNGWEWLKTSIKNNMNSLLEWVKGILGISSPSKLFADKIGKPIAQGIGAGITSAAGNVGNALANVTGGGISPTASPARISSSIAPVASRAPTQASIVINVGTMVGDGAAVTKYLIPHMRDGLRQLGVQTSG